MAWYLRKALSFGPLRLNLSKSGIGWSFGVKGARIGSKPSGRRYIHLGRHGIYYRRSLSSGDGQLVPRREELLPPDSPEGALSPVASVGVEHLIDESSADLLAEIRRVYNRTSRVKLARRNFWIQCPCIPISDLRHTSPPTFPSPVYRQARRCSTSARTAYLSTRAPR